MAYEQSPQNRALMDPIRGGAAGTYCAIAESLSILARLPAVATHDWTERAAGAVAALGGASGRACVLLVVDESTGKTGDDFRIESVGVRLGGADGPGETKPDEELAMRVRLERVHGFGVPRTPAMSGSGFAGWMGAMNRSWRDSPLGRVWAGTPVRDVLLGVSPIMDAGRASVLCMFANTEDEPQIPAEAFGSILGVLAQRAGLVYRSTDAADGELRWLTAREQDVLDALVNGHSVREIADRLGRSRHTMHDHVKNLHKKLNASCRGELVASALGHVEQSRWADLRMPVIIGGAGPMVKSSPIAELKPATAATSPNQE